jgi:hypothetical protein
MIASLVIWLWLSPASVVCDLKVKCHIALTRDAHRAVPRLDRTFSHDRVAASRPTACCELTIGASDGVCCSVRVGRAPEPQGAQREQNRREANDDVHTGEG